MRIPYLHGRPTIDPRYAHVVMTYKGRTLLGEVRDMYYSEVPAGYRLRVRFLNGEPWPFDPVCSAVEVLER